MNVAIRAGAQNIGFALPIDFVIGRAADSDRPPPQLACGTASCVKDTVVRDGDRERHAKRARGRRGGRSRVRRPPTAGFKTGDVIEQIDDVTVFTSIDLERGLLDKPAGAKIPVKVTRDGHPTNSNWCCRRTKVVALAPRRTGVEAARREGCSRSRPRRSRRPTRNSTAGCSSPKWPPGAWPRPPASRRATSWSGCTTGKRSTSTT